MAKNWDPLSDLQKLHNSINTKIGRALKEFKKPQSHISHNLKGAEIEVRLPGIKKEDLDVTISHKAVVIRAGYNVDEIRQTKKVFERKMEENTYFRKISLIPGLDVGKSQTKFNKNILRIKIPRKKR